MNQHKRFTCCYNIKFFILFQQKINRILRQKRPEKKLTHSRRLHLKHRVQPFCLKCLSFPAHKSLPWKNHSGRAASRLLRTAAAALALTLPARCDGGRLRAAKQPCVYTWPKLLDYSLLYCGNG